MLVVLLILHGLLAVALLGAVTHQAVSVLRKAQAPKKLFAQKFAAVESRSFTNSIAILYVLTIVAGGLFVYPTFRNEIRPLLSPGAFGAFETKEHFSAIGLGLLPAYLYYWKHAQSPERILARNAITLILSFIVWWGFLVGHVLNNIKGFA